jgi:adenine-specific DNA-methyltransferase
VNNIYGVDIDRQAVEVTQMSLYLKVLEGENAESLNPQMTLALKEVYLPSLAKNIKCGNSLIGTDFTSQGEMFDDEARRKVNPFDWEMEFPEIIKPKTLPLTGGDQPSPMRGRGDNSGHGFDVVTNNN